MPGALPGRRPQLLPKFRGGSAPPDQPTRSHSPDGAGRASRSSRKPAASLAPPDPPRRRRQVNRRAGQANASPVNGKRAFVRDEFAASCALDAGIGPFVATSSVRGCGSVPTAVHGERRPLTSGRAGSRPSVQRRQPCKSDPARPGAFPEISTFRRIFLGGISAKYQIRLLDLIPPFAVT